MKGSDDVRLHQCTRYEEGEFDAWSWYQVYVLLMSHCNKHSKRGKKYSKNHTRLA